MPLEIYSGKLCDYDHMLKPSAQFLSLLSLYMSYTSSVNGCGLPDPKVIVSLHL